MLHRVGIAMHGPYDKDSEKLAPLQRKSWEALDVLCEAHHLPLPRSSFQQRSQTLGVHDVCCPAAKAVVTAGVGMASLHYEEA